MKRAGRLALGVFIEERVSSRATEGRPGIHAGALLGKVREWIPDLRFAPSGMIRGLATRDEFSKHSGVLPTQVGGWAMP